MGHKGVCSPHSFEGRGPLMIFLKDESTGRHCGSRSDQHVLRPIHRVDRSASDLADSLCDAVHAIVHQGRDIDTAMTMLMARPLTFE